MDCSSTMHPNANKENVEGSFGRITRSRAKKALGGGVSIPPTKPSFKQVFNHLPTKRIAAHVTKKLLISLFLVYQQKKRSVLQDVSNTSAGNIYSDLLGGGNIKVKLALAHDIFVGI